jgi:DNA polymerase
VNCIHFLEKQLEIIKPQIIVALGAHAAKTLLKSTEAIGQLRGKFISYHTTSGYGLIKLMPTYHPSYLLRNYSDDNRRRVWEDMQKVMSELGMTVPKK